MPNNSTSRYASASRNRRRRSSLSALSALVFFASLTAAQEGIPGVAERYLEFRHKLYPYLVFSPNGEDRSRDLPAILLLHGAGGRGADLLAPWRDVARNNGVLLIAPDLPRDAAFEDAAPEFFRRLTSAVEAEWSVNKRRVYVFGHSMGGYLAFDAAMFDADVFAAAAVHASYIAPAYAGIVDRATRKIPIALYIGDADQAVSLEKVRATRELLLANGFPLHYKELRGHDHNYGAISGKINSDAWEFLSKQRLP